MGCACAWELARQGCQVTVLEKSVPGAEASSAAAGILGAQAEAHTQGPMLELSLASRARYGAWAKALFRETGIDIGYRTGGTLRVAFDARNLEALCEEFAWQKRERLKVAILSPEALHALEPKLATNAAGGIHFVNDARIDPRLLLRALHIAAQRAGVHFQSGAYVKNVVIEGRRATGVALDGGTILSAHEIVVAAGSWSTLIDGLGLARGEVVPARGQIVELSSPLPLLGHVVYGPRCYVVPRDDGRTLVGSTLEFVGYRREVTASAVRDLLDAAIELVPELGSAALNATWSSFRPYTPDELPLLGPSGIPGLTLATGHFRNGILLAPITAEVIGALLLGKKPVVSLEAFEPRRKTSLPPNRRAR